MNWPHAPAHWLFEPGLYMVTAGTYQKLPHLNSPPRLDFFVESLFACAAEFHWDLRAWAVLSNLTTSLLLHRLSLASSENS